MASIRVFWQGGNGCILLLDREKSAGWALVNPKGHAVKFGVCPSIRLGWQPLMLDNDVILAWHLASANQSTSDNCPPILCGSIVHISTAVSMISITYSSYVNL